MRRGTEISGFGGVLDLRSQMEEGDYQSLLDSIKVHRISSRATKTLEESVARADVSIADASREERKLEDLLQQMERLRQSIAAQYERVEAARTRVEEVARIVDESRLRVETTSEAAAQRGVGTDVAVRIAGEYGMKMAVDNLNEIVIKVISSKVCDKVQEAINKATRAVHGVSGYAYHLQDGVAEDIDGLVRENSEHFSDLMKVANSLITKDKMRELSTCFQNGILFQARLDLPPELSDSDSRLRSSRMSYQLRSFYDKTSKLLDGFYQEVTDELSSHEINPDLIERLFQPLIDDQAKIFVDNVASFEQSRKEEEVSEEAKIRRNVTAPPPSHHHLLSDLSVSLAAISEEQEEQSPTAFREMQASAAAPNPACCKPRCFPNLFGRRGGGR